MELGNFVVAAADCDATKKSIPFWLFVTIKCVLVFFCFVFITETLILFVNLLFRCVCSV